MKEPITISLTEFKNGYPDAWNDCLADFPWDKYLHALRFDDVETARIAYRHIQSCIEALEEEINHSPEPSQSEIDEDNRLMDNRDRIGAMK